MRARVPVLLLFLLALASSVLAADTHPFNVNDMWSMKRISDPQVSPDGKWVLFTLRVTDFEANKGRTDLWVIGADGKNMRQLTMDPGSDTNGRWSPDGSVIFFLSTRSGSSQVWKVPAGGGDAAQVTKLPLDASNLVLSRDGTMMAFSMSVFPGTTPDESAKKVAEKEKSKAKGQVYDQLFIRHWDTWADGRRQHVFVMPVTGSGNAVDVMKAMDADSPTLPFGGGEDITFTPDGKSVVFCAKNVGREEAWSTNVDLFVAPIDGSAEPRNLTEANKALDTRPTFSPDGKQIAWLAMARAGYEADRQALMVRAWPEGEAREVAPKWDRSFETIVWAPNGKTIYTIATNLGNQGVFSIDVAKGEVKTITTDGWANNIAGLSGKRIIYDLDHLRSPSEIYSASLDGKKIQPITNVNAELLSSVRFGDPEQFSFKGANNDDVYAWVVKPADFDATKKYPVAFLIHGGPQGSMSNHFHYRWNPEIYAAHGYAAIVIDFHGSTGYGQAFCDAIRDDWGGKPMEDLQKGLDAAIAKYSWMDGGNVVALGASYGGWMINWLAGQMPDRFKAFVCHDGNLDERSAYFATEELWFPEWEHMGTPWENPAGYSKHNPVDNVSKWKTPMLVIHGGLDYRVVATEGIGTFNVLQRRGIPSKFIYFPDENHWVLKPANSIQWHTEVLAWIDKWSGKAGGTAGGANQ